MLRSEKLSLPPHRLPHAFVDARACMERTEIVLDALFVDRHAFKDEPFGITRLQRSNFKNGIDRQRGMRTHDGKALHATLDDAHFEIQKAGHFNGTAKGHFAIALRKVHVTHAEKSVDMC